MPNILVLCQANQFRSVVTEYALRARLEPEVWTIASAGLWAEDGLPAVRGLGEWSGLLQISRHRSRVLKPEMLQSADLILVMERGQKEALSVEFPDAAAKIYLLSELSSPIPYDIPDPALGGENSKRLIEEIVSLVEKGLPRIIQLDGQT